MHTTVSIVTTHIHVLGMTCGHCERAVTAALLALWGVTDVTVDLASGLASIESDGRLDPVLVGAAVHDAGYDMEWAR